jgi:hypothetical protein
MKYNIDDSSAIEALIVMSASYPPRRGFLLRDIRSGNGYADFEVLRPPDKPARIRLALPSSGRDQFWLYAMPEDAEDWAGQLAVWLTEEVLTGGLSKGRLRANCGGESYVVPVAYGWQKRSKRVHRSYLKKYGGWYGSTTDQSD